MCVSPRGAPSTAQSVASADEVFVPELRVLHEVTDQGLCVRQRRAWAVDRSALFMVPERPECHYGRPGPAPPGHTMPDRTIRVTRAGHRLFKINDRTSKINYSYAVQPG